MDMMSVSKDVEFVTWSSMSYSEAAFVAVKEGMRKKNKELRKKKYSIAYCYDALLAHLDFLLTGDQYKHDFAIKNAELILEEKFSLGFDPSNGSVLEALRGIIKPKKALANSVSWGFEDVEWTLSFRFSEHRFDNPDIQKATLRRDFTRKEEWCFSIETVDAIGDVSRIELFRLRGSKGQVAWMLWRRRIEIVSMLADIDRGGPGFWFDSWHPRNSDVNHRVNTWEFDEFGVSDPDIEEKAVAFIWLQHKRELFDNYFNPEPPYLVS